MTARQQFKIVCADHPTKRSTIVTRFHIFPRYPDCATAIAETFGHGAVEGIRAERREPDCRRDGQRDRVRPAEWCAHCAEATWRTGLCGIELLDGAELLDPRLVSGSRTRPSNPELESKMRFRYPFKCWCGLRVDFTHERLERVVSDYADTGRFRVALKELAAKV